MELTPRTNTALFGESPLGGQSQGVDGPLWFEAGLSSPANKRTDDYRSISAAIDASLEVYGVATVDVAGACDSQDGALRVLQGFQALLDVLGNAVSLRESLESRIHRADDTESQLRLAKERIKAEREHEARERASADEKNRQLGKTVKKLTEDLKKAVEAARKTKSEKQQLAQQYTHAKKKLEREHAKLKERYAKLLSDKNSERKMGMQILNAIQRKGGQRGQWANAGRAGDDLTRLMATSFEERLQELRLENKELRGSLQALQQELASMMNLVGPVDVVADQSSITEPEGVLDGESGEADTSLEPGHFEMPFIEARERIEEASKQRMLAIRARLESVADQATDGSSGSDQAALDALQTKIDEYRELIDRQQQALLESQAASGGLPASPARS